MCSADAFGFAKPHEISTRRFGLGVSCSSVFLVLLVAVSLLRVSLLRGPRGHRWLHGDLRWDTASSGSSRSLDTGYPLLLRAWELYCGAGEHRRLEALCASVLVLLLLFVLVYSESGYQALPL